jgi:ribosomal protein L39E
VSELLYSPAAYGLDMSTRNMPRPKARIAAQVGNTKTPVLAGPSQMRVNHACVSNPQSRHWISRESTPGASAAARTGGYTS